MRQSKAYPPASVRAAGPSRVKKYFNKNNGENAKHLSPIRDSGGNNNKALAAAED